MSTKIIAVTGATGAQGGGVINIMKNVPGWKIRAVTRNPSSDSAVKLSQSGIEVVRADFDDEASLVKAFQVGALFACLFFSQPLTCRAGSSCDLRCHQLVGTSLLWQDSG